MAAWPERAGDLAQRLVHGGDGSVMQGLEHGDDVAGGIGMQGLFGTAVTGQSPRHYGPTAAEVEVDGAGQRQQTFEVPVLVGDDFGTVVLKLDSCPAAHDSFGAA